MRGMDEHTRIHWSKEDLAENVKTERTGISVEGWPADVRIVSVEGLSHFGIGDDGEVYFKGRRLYSAKRWGILERTLAAIGVGAAVVGAIATVASAVIAYWSYSAM